MAGTVTALHLYNDVIEESQILDTALFMFDRAKEGEEWAGSTQQTQLSVYESIQKITDKLNALCVIDPSLAELARETKIINDEIRNSPDSLVSLDVPNGSDPTDEVYKAPVVFRETAARAINILGLSPTSIPKTTKSEIDLLLSVCSGVGHSATYLTKRVFPHDPPGETRVKHILFAAIVSVFHDALPDGSTRFATALKNYSPDMSIPSIKACVETKVVRDAAKLAEALDGLLADLGSYGSSDYDRMIAVLYTDKPELMNLVAPEWKRRLQNFGSSPKYQWHIVPCYGPLSSKQ